MEWQKFYPKWVSLIGRIDREVLGEWNNFVSACGEELLICAIEETAQRYNTAREKDHYTPLPNLWQLKRAYNKLAAERADKLLSVRRCGFCENSASVYVLDTGNYQSDDFPVNPAVYQGRRNLCVVPCPHCRQENYQGMPRLKERIIRFCRSFSHRNELLKTLS